MMQREFSIWISIIVSVILLLSLPVWLDSEQPEITPVDRSKLIIPEQVCDMVRLSDPGHFTYSQAMICVNEEMELVVNTGHLTNEQYDRIIQPVLDSLKTLAVEKGIRRY